MLVSVGRPQRGIEAVYRGIGLVGDSLTQQISLVLLWLQPDGVTELVEGPPPRYGISGDLDLMGLNPGRVKLMTLKIDTCHFLAR